MMMMMAVNVAHMYGDVQMKKYEIGKIRLSQCEGEKEKKRDRMKSEWRSRKKVLWEFAFGV